MIINERTAPKATQALPLNAVPLGQTADDAVLKRIVFLKSIKGVDISELYHRLADESSYSETSQSQVYKFERF